MDNAGIAYAHEEENEHTLIEKLKQKKITGQLIINFNQGGITSYEVSINGKKVDSVLRQL